MAAKKSQREEIRLAAEANLETLIRLVHKNSVLGHIHEETIRWWYRDGASGNQLLLLPRGHRKSYLIACRAVLEIIRNPAVTILYVSSTSTLAVKQLKLIKDILTSDVSRYYWPDMVNVDEGKREKWTETEISVDHPKRKLEAVRDPTIFAAGLTTNVTGLHADIIIYDDVVVSENAFTEDSRNKTQQQYSLLASVANAGAKEWIVGTRYHPKDLYSDVIAMRSRRYNSEGELISDEPLFDVKQEVVENMGDGSGEYLWPRQQRYDGRWFGFNQEVLADIKEKYLDQIQFRAQYYNNPNDESTAAISRDYFQYYDKRFLERNTGKWTFKQKRLNVFASIDFAFSMAKKADYSSIVVVGVDGDRNFYVLDIDRFKTDQPSVYFDHILRLHQKWDFRVLRAEVTTAQKALVEGLKNDYIRRHGLALSIDEFRPTRNEGTKEERIMAILQPRYANRQMWHYQGGLCQTLEEELVLTKPPHDDVKDALASAVDVAKAPSSMMATLNRLNLLVANKEAVHSRFGGIA